jgi:hypothetical protein
LRSGAGNRGCKDASFSGQRRLASGCATIFNCPKEYSFLTASVPAAIPLYDEIKTVSPQQAKTFKVSSVLCRGSERHDSWWLADTFAFTAFRPIDAEQFRQGDGEPFADAWFYCGQSRSRRFHAALAVIAGVRPKTRSKRCWRPTWLSRILLCSNCSPARAAPSQGLRTRVIGIKRLDILGSLTNKFHAHLHHADRSTGQEKAQWRAKHKRQVCAVHSGGQAVVGNVSHRGGRGVTKNDQAI